MDTTFKIIEFLQSNQIPYEENVDMKTKTWIKRGGIAKFWLQPKSMEVFENIVSWCQRDKVKFDVIGNTSNCYFLNDYNPKMVISTLKLNKIEVNKDDITCECGHNMIRLAKHCISNGISGYEGFVGLPGTIGGAVVNNAGCYGSLISDLVEKIILLINGQKVELLNKELGYVHRSSYLKEKKIDGVILYVIFKKGVKESPYSLQLKANEFTTTRKLYYESKSMNLGSVFSLLQFKPLIIWKKCLLKSLIMISHVFIWHPTSRQFFATRIQLIFRRAGKIKKYISPHNIRCFVWKDSNADHAFKDYLKFIERETVKSKMEIEIRK